MPGTWGTFVGLIFYTIFFHSLPPFEFTLLSVLCIGAACQLCTEAEKIFHTKDPPCAIVDEIVAVPLCFVGLRPWMDRYSGGWFMLLGFILFRFFDIVKPLGIRKIQELEGGKGVVYDDLLAAVYTCLCLHLWVWVQWPPFQRLPSSPL
jgi:phosphatidylglycerophosphatase A